MAAKGDQAELPLLERKATSSTWPADAPAYRAERQDDGGGKVLPFGPSEPKEPRPDDQRRKAVLCSELEPDEREPAEMSELLLTSQQSLPQHDRLCSHEGNGDFEPAGTSAPKVGHSCSMPVRDPLSRPAFSDASAHPLSWSIAWKGLLEGSGFHLPGSFVGLVIEDEALAKRDITTRKPSGKLWLLASKFHDCRRMVQCSHICTRASKGPSRVT